MKRFAILLMTLVLTAGVLTGCGCRKSMPMDTKPTTEATTKPTTIPTTEATTRPTETTTPTGETFDNGNGPLPTDETGASEEPGRSRQIPGDMQR